MRLFRTPLVLLAALAVGLVAHRIGSAERAAPRGREPLVARDSIDPERLAEVLLDREGTRYRFVRRGQSWWQTSPVEHAVDGWSIRQFAARVTKAESVRSVEVRADDAVSLAAAGLAPAQGRIELVEESSGGAPARRVVVELGRRSLAGRAYARAVEPAQPGVRPAQPSVRYEVVDGSLHQFALERDPREFRRRDLFIDLGEVDRIGLTSGGSTTSIARSGRNFRIEEPIRTRADRQQCEELVDAIRRARSEGFIVDNPAELSVYGLEPAAAVLAVRSGSRETRLRIGDPVSIGAQDRFGLVEGTNTVVRIPAAVLAGIAPRAERLVDAVASGVRAADVGAIEITQGPVRLSLRRETDRWNAAWGEPKSGEGAGAADDAAVRRLLSALTEARAGSVRIAVFPAEREVATITLRGFAGEALDTVRVASEAEGGFLFENGDGVLRAHGAIDLPLSPAELGCVTRPLP
jgi:hypothetical protein